jgi:hypothetical protein
MACFKNALSRISQVNCSPNPTHHDKMENSLGNAACGGKFAHSVTNLDRL